MISYEPFWQTMKRRKMTSYALIHKHGISNGTLYRMRKGNHISTQTIDDLCRILHCKPGNIIEYIEMPQEEKEKP